MSENEHEKVQILIKAQNLDGIAEVKRISGQDDAIVTDAHGQEVQIRVAEITEIQTIRHIKIRPRETASGSTAEAVGDGLIYAPLIPVAIATWPFLRAIGLDAGKNADDKGKAMMAYGGISKEDLIAYIGIPMEKYHCKGEHGDLEIWIYEKSQVLREGCMTLSEDRRNLSGKWWYANNPKETEKVQYRRVSDDMPNWLKKQDFEGHLNFLKTGKL